MGKRANAARAAKVAKWEAYQRDIIALGEDIRGFRARAAAGGRRISQEYETASSSRYEEAASKIRAGGAYQSTYDDYLDASRPVRRNPRFPMGDPTAPEIRDRRDLNFEKWASKEYGTVEGFKVGGLDPRRNMVAKSESLSRRKRVASASVGTGVNFSQAGPDYTGGLY